MHRLTPRTRRVLYSLTAAASLTTGAYYGNKYFFPVPQTHRPPVPAAPLVSLPLMKDEDYETQDELCVFVLSSPEVREQLQPEISEIASEIRRRGLTWKLYYSYPKEVVTSDTPPAVQVVLYKGNRRDRKFLDKKFPINTLVDEFQQFMIPISKDLSANEPASEQQGGIPPEVTLKTFELEILESSKKFPIILQVYEPGCFLCFLMRPLVNSVRSEILSENIKLEIKKFDLENNDFPASPEFPVVRATPTFLFYKGGRLEERWAEFRPSEVVEKIGNLDMVPEKIGNLWNKFPILLSERFRLFSTMVMWRREADEAQQTLVSGNFQKFPTPSDDKDKFNAEISAAMAEDAERVDGLLENVEYLKKEVRNAELDAIAIAIQLAKRVVHGETHLSVA